INTEVSLFVELVVAFLPVIVMCAGAPKIRCPPACRTFTGVSWSGHQFGVSCARQWPRSPKQPGPTEVSICGLGQHHDRLPKPQPRGEQPREPCDSLFPVLDRLSGAVNTGRSGGSHGANQDVPCTFFGELVKDVQGV